MAEIRIHRRILEIMRYRTVKEFTDLLFAMYCTDDQLKADELNLVHVRPLISLFHRKPTNAHMYY